MPSPVYSYITLAVARQQLANRLYDSTPTFYSAAELNQYIVEALRTWNALAAYWRGDFTFPAVQGTVFYDITDPAVAPNTLRSLTVKDIDIYNAIAFHLLEPTSAGTPWAWTGSAQFTADDIIQAVARRRDEILSITGCSITRRLVGAVAGRIALPDTVIDVRRMAYLPSAGGQKPSVVWPDDTWAEQSFERGYLQTPAGTPSTYLLSAQPPISFDVNVPPGFAGQYELLTVEAGAALTAAAPSTFTIPNDWTHVIKWGALMDLLGRESNARDSLRAKYCSQRYQMGLSLLSAAPAMLAMRVGNVPLLVDSVREADLFDTGWQARAQGTPATAMSAGLNLVALSPPPAAGPFSLTATVVQNAPVPAVDPDPLQVGRDDLDAVLDYAQHLAAFKQGGAEFLATLPLFQNFMAQAAVYNRKLAALGEFSFDLLNVSEREQERNPRLVPAGGA